jgi:hypothetical protein
VIPVIRTHADRLAFRRRMILATCSCAVLTIAAGCILLVYRYRTTGL